MTKRHSDAEVASAAAKFEQWADEVDPAGLAVERTDDLAEVAAAADAIEAAQRRLDEAVRSARTKGRSWGRIGLAMGVSRQAVQQRYGTPEAASTVVPMKAAPAR